MVVEGEGMVVVGVVEDTRGIVTTDISIPDVTGIVVTEDVSLSTPAIFAFLDGRSSSACCCLSFQLGCRLRVK
jgi:hypothetical protein